MWQQRVYNEARYGLFCVISLFDDADAVDDNFGRGAQKKPLKRGEIHGINVFHYIS
jgi:hypothetical protein